MTLNGKNNNQFWFTFFHEVGHLLLHGKKEVFLEQIEYKAKGNFSQASCLSPI
jgi:HTH-type transcriptional regulator / antitoxin HigA